MQALLTISRLLSYFLASTERRGKRHNTKGVEKGPVFVERFVPEGGTKRTGQQTRKTFPNRNATCEGGRASLKNRPSYLFQIGFSAHLRVTKRFPLPHSSINLSLSTTLSPPLQRPFYTILITSVLHAMTYRTAEDTFLLHILFVTPMGVVRFAIYPSSVDTGEYRTNDLCFHALCLFLSLFLFPFCKKYIQNTLFHINLSNKFFKLFTTYVG